ncbi:hypothetical protein GALMADRAFT_205819 [Galerina marginata CBS 339.88]|uniref:Uncharacterized protein n=1 Tax=Galerina marginata (strain CBS 339.88) TaxID=685588 RepID=A0A067TLN1_GALM3|nr:hypothetical protein GALMADRAFT_205819 [Galerina marginata CBS 339.88]
MCSNGAAQGRPLPSAKLLRRTQSFPNFAGWGFLLDLERLKEHAKGEVPNSTFTDPARLWGARQTRMIALIPELRGKCHDIWPCFRTSGAMQTTFQGEPETVVAIFKCTRRDDKFLPPPESIEKMKELFVSYEFTKEPGWFIGD